MAVQAGGKALANSGLSPADIDLVIVATCTPEAQIPNASAQVADRLGIVAPGAYDVNAACAGFCYALSNAADAIRAGSARNVLVIGAEKLSQWVDWTDRSTCIIFADGAGAAVLGPSEDTADRPGGVGQRRRHGRQDHIKDREQLPPPGGPERVPVGHHRTCTRWPRRPASAPGSTPADLAAFVPHQANLRIVEAIARKLGRTTRSSPTTSWRPATPRPPRSRSPCPA